jgi:hypothetical protein
MTPIDPVGGNVAAGGTPHGQRARTTISDVVAFANHLEHLLTLDGRWWTHRVHVDAAAHPPTRRLR